MSTKKPPVKIPPAARLNNPKKAISNKPVIPALAIRSTNIITAKLIKKPAKKMVGLSELNAVSRILVVVGVILKANIIPKT